MSASVQQEFAGAEMMFLCRACACYQTLKSMYFVTRTGWQKSNRKSFEVEVGHNNDIEGLVTEHRNLYFWSLTTF